MSTSSGVASAQKIFEYLRGIRDAEASAKGPTLGAKKATEAVAMALGDDFEVSPLEQKAVQEGVKLFLARAPGETHVSNEAKDAFAKFGIQIDVSSTAVDQKKLVEHVLEFAKSSYAGNWGKDDYKKEKVDAMMYFFRQLSPDATREVIFEVSKFNPDLALYIAGQPSSVNLI